MEAEGAARALRSRCERLEREASSRAESLHQLQHSLYVVRAHWGGLAQGLARLARLASTRAPGALLDEAAADPSAQAHLPEQLAALGREWEPASKGALDKAVSESLGAGAAIVEAAADAFQVCFWQAACVQLCMYNLIVVPCLAYIARNCLHTELHAAPATACPV